MYGHDIGAAFIASEEETMPVWFIVFCAIVAACVVVIIFDPPITRRPLDRLATRWRTRRLTRRFPSWYLDGCRERDISPWDAIPTAPMPPYDSGLCRTSMRATGSISCYWPCDFPAGHDGLHRWIGVDGTVVRFTTEEARMSWQGDANRNVVPSFHGPRGAA
jgi:hypothetical protein